MDIRKRQVPMRGRFRQFRKANTLREALCGKTTEVPVIGIRECAAPQKQCSSGFVGLLASGFKGFDFRPVAIGLYEQGIDLIDELGR